MHLAENVVVAERFRLNGLLGRGGMGSVWHATHLGLDVPCAVKFIEGQYAGLAEAAVRFQREAKAAARLRSPHVVQILDHGIFEGTPYIAMELLEGEDLGKRLARAKRLAPADVLWMVRDVARALGKAHAAGIVHRDLKPDNVFLVHDDEREIAKVLDFGIAKTNIPDLASAGTSTGAMLGTPHYMSPEQAQGTREVDPRSDLWSLAVIVFECLTGQRPFDSEALGDLLMRIIVLPLPVPSKIADVPPGFDAWWQRAVARDPKDRFQSARELAQALAPALGLADRGSLPDDRASLLDGRASLPGARPPAPPGVDSATMRASGAIAPPDTVRAIDRTVSVAAPLSDRGSLDAIPPSRGPRFSAVATLHGATPMPVETARRSSAAIDDASMSDDDRRRARRRRRSRGAAMGIGGATLVLAVLAATHYVQRRRVTAQAIAPPPTATATQAPAVLTKPISTPATTDTLPPPTSATSAGTGAPTPTASTSSTVAGTGAHPPPKTTAVTSVRSPPPPPPPPTANPNTARVSIFSIQSTHGHIAPMRDALPSAELTACYRASLRAEPTITGASGKLSLTIDEGGHVQRAVLSNSGLPADAVRCIQDAVFKTALPPSPAGEQGETAEIFLVFLSR